MTLCLLIFLPGLLRAIKNASAAATLAVLYLGVFPAAFAYFCWSFVLSRMPASRASAFLYLVPVISIVIGYVWLKEIPARLSLIGGCLALGGVVLVNTLGRRPTHTVSQITSVLKVAYEA